MEMKLLGIVSVDFDVLIKYFAFVRY